MAKNMDISKKAVHGGLWLIWLQIVTILASFAGTIVYARLLSPNDFGLVGIALIFIAAVDAFSKTGVEAALIQRKENYNEYLDAAWTMQIIRGTIIFSIFFIMAPYIANFFDAPRATNIIRIMGFTFLFQSFRNIGIVFFRKDLEFRKQFLLKALPVIFGVVIGVSAAFILRNVWALIIGSLVRGGGEFLLSYILHSYKPRFKIDLQQFKKLFTFGRWIFLSAILFFLTARADNLIAGKILGVTALGFYAYSYNFVDKTIIRISKAFSGVTFPAFSKIQDDIPKVINGFIKTLEVLSFFTFLIAMGIFVLCPEFVTLFLGNKWMPIVPVVRILCVSNVLLSIRPSSHFVALRRPNLPFYVNGTRAIFMLISIIPLTLYCGIKGTALGVLIGIIFSLPLWFYYTYQLLHVGCKEILNKLLPIAIGAGFAGFIVWNLKTLFTHIGLVEFFGLVFGTVILYFCIEIFFWKAWRRGPIGSLYYLKKSV